MGDQRTAKLCPKAGFTNCLLPTKYISTLCIRLTVQVELFSREVYNSFYSGPWCKELQCFYKRDISGRGYILGLLLERCHLLLHFFTFNFIMVYSNLCRLSHHLLWLELIIPSQGTQNFKHLIISIYEFCIYISWWLIVVLQSFYQICWFPCLFFLLLG